MLFLSVLALIATFTTPSARANDGYAAIGVGGIEFKKSDHIRLLKEHLTISPTRIRVDYEFKNEGPADEKVLVAFPLPPTGYCDDDSEGPSCDWKHKFEGMSFTVTVDGKSIPEKSIEHIVEVLVPGKPGDQSALLEKYGLDFRKDYTFEQLAKLPKEAQAELSKAGFLKTTYEWSSTWWVNSEGRALRSDSSGRDQDITDDLKRAGFPSTDKRAFSDAVASMTDGKKDELVKLHLLDKKENGKNLYSEVRLIHHWNQVFKAGQTTRISHTYPPMIGSQLEFFGLIEQKAPEGNYFIKKYCIDETTLAAMKKLNGVGWAAHDPAFVDYILTTANTWKGPIQDFTLTLEKPNEKESIVSVCFDGMKKVGPKTFEAHRTNFSPEKELSVLFWGKVDERRQQ